MVLERQLKYLFDYLLNDMLCNDEIEENQYYRYKDWVNSKIDKIIKFKYKRNEKDNKIEDLKRIEEKIIEMKL